MSTRKFDPASCTQLLRGLVGTQASIEAVAARALWWKRHAKDFVKCWEHEFRRSDATMRLNLIYVANDILQKSREAGRFYVEEFFKYLPQALQHMMKHSDEAVQKKLKRLVNVWSDRKVFGATAMKTFRTIVGDKADAPDDAMPQQGLLQPPVDAAAARADVVKALTAADAAKASAHESNQAAAPQIATALEQGVEASHAHVQATISAVKHLISTHAAHLKAERAATQMLEGQRRQREASMRACTARSNELQSTLQALKTQLSRLPSADTGEEMAAEGEGGEGSQQADAQAYDPSSNAAAGHMHPSAHQGQQQGQQDDESGAMYDPDAPMDEEGGGGAFGDEAASSEQLAQMAAMLASAPAAEAADAINEILAGADESTREEFGKELMSMMEAARSGLAAGAHA